MSTILTAVGAVFTAMFGATGYISQVVSLITSTDYLLVGLALMITGAAVSYLARIIHNT